MVTQVADCEIARNGSAGVSVEQSGAQCRVRARYPHVCSVCSRMLACVSIPNAECALGDSLYLLLLVQQKERRAGYSLYSLLLVQKYNYWYKSANTDAKVRCSRIEHNGSQGVCARLTYADVC
jgi:hypothetical protein